MREYLEEPEQGASYSGRAQEFLNLYKRLEDLLFSSYED